MDVVKRLKAAKVRIPKLFEDYPVVFWLVIISGFVAGFFLGWVVFKG